MCGKERLLLSVPKPKSEGKSKASVLRGKNCSGLLKTMNIGNKDGAHGAALIYLKKIKSIINSTQLLQLSRNLGAVFMQTKIPLEARMAYQRTNLRRG